MPAASILSNRGFSSGPVLLVCLPTPAPVCGLQLVLIILDARHALEALLTLVIYDGEVATIRQVQAGCCTDMAKDKNSHRLSSDVGITLYNILIFTRHQ